MPSGREIHTVQAYRTPELDADALVHLRSPAEPGDGLYGAGAEDSDDEGNDRLGSQAYPTALPGAFPSASGDVVPERSYY